MKDSKHIKRFDEINEEVDNSFSDEKDNILNKLELFTKEYEEFTKKVSPKNWRSTGHHFTELRNIKDDISKFSEITDKDKESDFVKKQIE